LSLATRARPFSTGPTSSRHRPRRRTTGRNRVIESLSHWGIELLGH
jgi:hypothetical protein